tara:strand:+ start:7344 stop:8381 length:1038 start_codon:yes stop_codon:yes gene_type:complete
MNTPPSLQDIADEAGVSRMTVSRALRNEKRCSPKTREHILRIADKLGYRPNPLVVARMQQMRQRHPQQGVSLAIVQPGPSGLGLKNNENTRQWYEGMKERAEERGFRSELINLPLDQKEANAVIRALTYRNIDGLCFLPFPQWGWNMELDISPFSVGAIGFTLTDPKLHRVASDCRQGIILSMQKLLESGYQRIGLILEKSTSSRIDHQHLEVYMRHQQFGLLPAALEPLLLEGDLSRPKVLSQFLSWFSKYKPDVIISHLDHLPFLKESDISIPEDVGFISLDVQANDPDISGINQQPRRIGACLVDRVVSRIYYNERGVPEQPELSLVPPSWNPGGTIRTLSA